MSYTATGPEGRDVGDARRQNALSLIFLMLTITAFTLRFFISPEMMNIFVNYTLGSGTRFDRTKLKLAVNNLTDSHAITAFTPGLKTTNLPNPADVLTMLAGRSVSFSVTVGFSPRVTP